jgi:[ribosomal protein S5]-alanine N-acetyltransferase
MPRLKPHLAPGALSQRPQPELVTPSLTLRPWCNRDAGVVIDAFADPDIAFWHRRTVKGGAEAREWLDRCERRWKNDAGAYWAVCASDSGEVLGRVALTRVDLFEGLGVLGYWVLPLARGRGIAVQAVVTMSSWALHDLGLQRLELAHSVRNSPSCRVAVKAGYEQEGTLKSALRHADGYHDMHLHALVR